MARPRSSRGRPSRRPRPPRRSAGTLRPARRSPLTSPRSASCSRRRACCSPTSAGSVPGREARIGAARSALVRGETTLVELADDLDLRLRTDRLVPLSRWVTPPSMPRRFDARFFAAILPPGAEATFEGDEVAAHAWLRPTDALAAMAAGRLAMWLPTSTTLQQLEHARSIEEIRDRLAPGRARPDRGHRGRGRRQPDRHARRRRCRRPAGFGLSRRPASVRARRSGRSVGPGARSRAGAGARPRGAIEAIALTHVDPDHAAGAQAVAEILGIPVFVGPGGGASLPYVTRELRDLDMLDAGDIGLQVLSTPGLRRDHVVLVDAGGRFVIAGDLDGVRGARSIPGPVDQAALARLRRARPGGRARGRLAGGSSCARGAAAKRASRLPPVARAPSVRSRSR